ncbi:MAG: methyltransferase domain-containing protein [Chloroflexi bacterium]|nr:methyltransferase domain-containing protein [Chloroflexota bacterium]
MIELRPAPVDTLADSGAAYDAIYENDLLRQRDSFYIWILDELRVAPGGTLLDVSCGVGPLLRAAAAAGLRPTGLDFSAAALAEARELLAGAALVLGDAERLPFGDATFDYVTNIGSIEHYFAPERGAAELARVLRPDGRAAVLLPNAFALLHVLHVWRSGDVFDDGQPIQRYATRQRWSELLESNGLVVERTLKYERERPRTWRDVLWHLPRPGKLARLALTPFLPLDAANCFLFICRRRS